MRFTLRLTDDEAVTLTSFRDWYEDQVGVPISKNSLIKKILFDVLKDKATSLNGV